jgi:hypothetical protein
VTPNNAARGVRISVGKARVRLSIDGNALSHIGEKGLIETRLPLDSNTLSTLVGISWGRFSVQVF